MLAVMFFAVISGGCGGGSDSSDPEQTESINQDTGSDDAGEYDPNDEGGRGTSGTTVDLSTLTADYTAQNGEILTGTLGAIVKISIADGATVTLRDATINGVNQFDKDVSGRYEIISPYYEWAGLSCLGNATIILEGTNNVKGFYEYYSGIHVPEGRTLTIKGSGELTASSNGSAAGIGGGFRISCGNIVIDGGTITAIGGTYAAGIGGGGKAKCGNITITDNIAKVTAVKGTAVKQKYAATHSIGAGNGGSCGTVKIGWAVGAISESSYTYCPILSHITKNYTAQNGQTLQGTLNNKGIKVSIADGATITLDNAVINGVNSRAHRWAGLTCEGDATIILKGTNTVKGFCDYYPGIHVRQGKTLTIKGDGSLTASSNGSAAGIGGGYWLDCGNIVIEGGTITAIGGYGAAGIGGGLKGICGNITIKDTIAKVAATKGDKAAHSIGSGYNGRCGTVTLGGTVSEISDSTYTYNPILSHITENYTARNGEILQGTLENKGIKISIADGATITIDNAVINGIQNGLYKWAGLNCEGNATIILKGTNTVKGFYFYYPGIHVPEGRTLTIKGDGELTASSNGNAAGIGGGNAIHCGNIVIDGGTITAIGGERSAGIGSGMYARCGNITITKNVTKVTAVKGSGRSIQGPNWIEEYVAQHSIGAGDHGTCGTVTIGGIVGPIAADTYTYDPKCVDLSRLTAGYTFQDGEALTGTLGANVKLSIADGATVTIRDITINGVDDSNYWWAGLNCLGDATIILEGTNSVKGFHSYSPGIHVVQGKTLTIKGSGSLDARSNGWAAGIGGGVELPCGNIVIDGGTINAVGGRWSAGIGGGYAASCGTITITDKVTKVTATMGISGTYSIGAGGKGGTCGTVTIGGKVGAIAQSTYTYQP